MWEKSIPQHWTDSWDRQPEAKEGHYIAQEPQDRDSAFGITSRSSQVCWAGRSVQNRYILILRGASTVGMTFVEQFLWNMSIKRDDMEHVCMRRPGACGSIPSVLDGAGPVLKIQLWENRLVTTGCCCKKHQSPWNYFLQVRGMLLYTRSRQSHHVVLVWGPLAPPLQSHRPFGRMALWRPL